MVQRFGTDKVGYTFAPIICIWFALIASIGFYNFIKYDPSVIKAINPKYIVDYFIRNKKDAWISLGGVVLCTTGSYHSSFYIYNKIIQIIIIIIIIITCMNCVGSEALFADVGHFTVRSIQLSMCFVTYPTLILAYAGQASFLRKNNDLVADTFYESIPGNFKPNHLVADTI
jgi:KUP system potassium uptake protein